LKKRSVRRKARRRRRKKEVPEPVPDDEKRMTFLEHLGELRQRLLVCIVALGIGFVISYVFSDKIFNILLAPLKPALPPGSTLIFIGVTEAFMTYVKVAFLSAVILSSPIWIYEIWLFVAPGLYKSEKKYVLPMVISSAFLFAAGALFGYFVVFPYAFQFLVKGYATEAIRPLPTMSEYFSLAWMLLLGFGLCFEMPVIIVLLARIGIVSASTLSKYRRYAILAIAVVAAAITPTPDAFTMLILMAPLLVLYEVSVLLARIFEK